MTAPKIGPQNAISDNPGVRQQLYDDAGTNTLFSASALPASGAWRASEVFNIQVARSLMLEVFYNAHASTTTGYPELLVKVSNAEEAPATGDDVWNVLSLKDDLVSGTAALTGTLPTGTDFTADPLNNAQLIRGGLFRTSPAAANSAKIREPFMFNVQGWRWCQVYAHEKGDTTNIGTLFLWASLSS